MKQSSAVVDLGAGLLRKPGLSCLSKIYAFRRNCHHMSALSDDGRIPSTCADSVILTFLA